MGGSSHSEFTNYNELVTTDQALERLSLLLG